MGRRLQRWVGGAAALAAASCVGRTAPIPLQAALLDAGTRCAGSATTGDIPCGVAAVLAARCQVCHQDPPLNRAPFPLLTYEELAAPLGTTGLTKWQRMAQVIEPGNFPHMPPSGWPQLGASELTTLESWFDACAPPVPEGTGCDVGERPGRDATPERSPGDAGTLDRSSADASSSG